MPFHPPPSCTGILCSPHAKTAIAHPGPQTCSSAHPTRHLERIGSRHPPPSTSIPSHSPPCRNFPTGSSPSCFPQAAPRPCRSCSQEPGTPKTWRLPPGSNVESSASSSSQTPHTPPLHTSSLPSLDNRPARSHISLAPSPSAPDAPPHRGTIRLPPPTSAFSRPYGIPASNIPFFGSRRRPRTPLIVGWSLRTDRSSNRPARFPAIPHTP